MIKSILLMIIVVYGVFQWLIWGLSCSSSGDYANVSRHDAKLNFIAFGLVLISTLFMSWK